MLKPGRADNNPIRMSPQEFKEAGHKLVDRISELLEELPSMHVTKADTTADLRVILPEREIPESGSEVESILSESFELLRRHSLYNGHPRFFGFITSSPAPIGMLADLLAAAINQNVGGQILSPLATEIERQCIKWIAQFIGYPDDCGGILVSGGNMANFTGFLVGRRQKGGQDIRQEGIQRLKKPMVVYTSAETHTWVQKAADLFGLGTASVRWIDCDERQRMIPEALEEKIKEDLQKGLHPIMAIGTAGSVSTGAIDPLDRIADICNKYDLWFHVDGAYGAMAAAVDSQKKKFSGLERADSIALDPHKWLYTPLEAGCTLVRDEKKLRDTFSFHPPYYYMGDDTGYHNYHEYGMQNSRAFRALKVWMSMRQVGSKGYKELIGDDIKLARIMYEAVQEHPELEAVTCDLSITTFRYVPPQLAGDEEKLNELNVQLLERLQEGGEIFLSNALIDGKFCLRACIVNFNTEVEDVEAVPEIVVKEGKQILNSK